MFSGCFSDQALGSNQPLFREWARKWLGFKSPVQGNLRVLSTAISICSFSKNSPLKIHYSSGHFSIELSM